VVIGESAFGANNDRTESEWSSDSTSAQLEDDALREDLRNTRSMVRTAVHRPLRVVSSILDTADGLRLICLISVGEFFNAFVSVSASWESL
jgi:hypothetical protein